MKTIELEMSLYRYLDFRKNIIIPNISAWGKSCLLFECDLFMLSPSNYATGIELKISKSDLKNDLNKDHIKYLNEINLINGKSYLEIFFNPFKYFYYAVPENLKETALEQIPIFCGLLVAYKNEYGISIKQERFPKLLFNKKWSDKDKMEIMRLGIIRNVSLTEYKMNHGRK